MIDLDEFERAMKLKMHGGAFRVLGVPCEALLAELRAGRALREAMRSWMAHIPCDSELCKNGVCATVRAYDRAVNA